LHKGSYVSDKVKSNFMIKKDIDQSIKLGPQERLNKVRRFLDTIINNEEGIKALQKHNLTISKDLEKVKGKELKAIEVMFGGNKV
jgi:hypothetical protein